MFTRDPFFWLAIRNTLWIVVFGVPLRIVFAIFDGMAADAPETRRRASTGRSTSCRRWRRRPPRRWPSRSCSTRSGRSTRSWGAFGMHVPPLWFYGPAIVEMGARPAGAVGGRGRDDHLPRGPARRAASAVRGRGHRGSERPAEVPAHHAADDLAGHLLLARDRRDLRVPALHAGLRREPRGVRELRLDAAQNLGTPQGSMLSSPSTSSSRGS